MSECLTLGLYAGGGVQYTNLGINGVQVLDPAFPGGAVDDVTFTKLVYLWMLENLCIDTDKVCSVLFFCVCVSAGGRYVQSRKGTPQRSDHGPSRRSTPRASRTAAR